MAAVCLLAAPAQAEGRFDDLGPKAFDVFPLRVLTVFQVVCGAVLFIPAGSLSAGLGYLAAPANSATTAKTNFGDAWDVFVLEPFERAFLTPLGSF